MLQSVWVRHDGQFISTKLGAVMGLGVAHIRRPISQSSPCPGLLYPIIAIVRPGYCDGLNVTRQPRAGYTLFRLPTVALPLPASLLPTTRAATLPSMISPRGSNRLF